MSAWKPKPGDVAIINVPSKTLPERSLTDSGREEVAAAYSLDGWTLLTDVQYFWDSDYAFFQGEPRPLVVIDPEDREQVERLAKSMHESDHIAPWHDLHNETRSQIEAAMQAALRSLLAPPTPDEPTGLGAVVEDQRGEWWVRDKTTTTVNHWKRARGEDGGRRYPYSDIAAVRVLSEGVAE